MATTNVAWWRRRWRAEVPTYDVPEQVLREFHRYDPGSYTVTISWTSAGCAGDDEQAGSTTVTVQV